MKTTIVYESMFGATRRIAEAIARGARTAGGVRVEVSCRRVTEVRSADVADTDVLVLGGPTHAHSMSRPSSRTQAEKWAQDPKQGLTLEPDARDRGIREFIKELPSGGGAFVAFGTRVEAPEMFTGSAANAIGKRLEKKGLRPLLPARTFLVNGASRLLEGEEARAEDLGRALVEAAGRRDASVADASDA